MGEEAYFFYFNDWVQRETGYHLDIPLQTGRISTYRTTYHVITKTSDVSGATCDANAVIVISGEYGDTGELKLTYSPTHSKKFQRDHEDIFIFENVPSLGPLNKLWIWLESATLPKTSWHLEYVQIDDIRKGKKYMFPCNQWLSYKNGDQQVGCELTCTNALPNKIPYELATPRGEVSYEIEIVTSDRQNAGTTQHAWIIIEGNRKKSDKLLIENPIHHSILQR
jgi:hypothetical protein